MSKRNQIINDIITALLSSKDFSKSFDDLCSFIRHYDTNTALEVISSNADIFTMSFREDGCISVKFEPVLQICREHTADICRNKRCSHLHICSFYVHGKCRFSDDDCENCHDFSTDHNQNVLARLHLSAFSSRVLLKLLQQDTGSHSLRVCTWYNGTGCNNSNCHFLHVCWKYIDDRCRQPICKLNHRLRDDGQCSSILSKHGINVNEAPKELKNRVRNMVWRIPPSRPTAGSLGAVGNTVSRAVTHIDIPKCPKEILNTSHLDGTVETPEICMFSINNRCRDKKCGLLHARVPFQWQISVDGQRWYNLREKQNRFLYEKYCNVNVTKCRLPKLDRTQLQDSLVKLLQLLGEEEWDVDFDKGSMNASGGQNLNLRVLTTQSKVNHTHYYATGWKWYWQDDRGHWVSYETEKSSPMASDAIEAQYTQKLKGLVNSKINCQNNKFIYEIDFDRMVQKNTNTGKERAMRRRIIQPSGMKGKKENTSETFPSTWSPMNEDEDLKIEQVTDQTELSQVKILFSSIGNNIVSVQRIQNKYHYRRYEMKRRQLMKRYNDDIQKVNEKQLFHGTRGENVDKICQQNFEWRLSGTNVGQAFGQGVYFGGDARTSLQYANPDSTGKRYLFVARVLVGMVTTGDSRTRIPPQVLGQNYHYDTTVDHVHYPGKFVKYYDEDFYPEYIVTLK